jgi:hypothetical protein
MGQRASVASRGDCDGAVSNARAVALVRVDGGLRTVIIKKTIAAKLATATKKWATVVVCSWSESSPFEKQWHTL